jgi:hypothetical protein
MRTGQRALLARGRKTLHQNQSGADCKISRAHWLTTEEMNRAGQVHKPSRTEEPAGVEIRAGGEAVGKAKQDHEQAAPPVIGVENLGRLPWRAVKHQNQAAT